MIKSLPIGLSICYCADPHSPRAALKGLISALPYMTDMKLRKAIAARAASLMYAREESEYFTAKRKAAKQLGVNCRYQPHGLPSNKEIQESLRRLAESMEGPARADRLEQMRLEALRWLRRLDRFSAKLIGSVLTGHVRRGSDIDIHVFTDSLNDLTLALDDHGVDYQVERKQVVKHRETRVYRHVHIDGRYPVELTVYSAAERSYPFLSSITGKPIEKCNAEALEALLLQENPGLQIQESVDRADDFVDVSWMFRTLLHPLAEVKQSPVYHPEGDALYHSLQVFDLAMRERPYDEEFVIAALMHDVGKAIDPGDHSQAGVEALEGLVTDRTLWLIEHHMAAHQIHERTIGHRAHQRLSGHPDYEDLLLLGELDRAGRRVGAVVPTVEQALEQIGQIAGSL